MKTTLHHSKHVEPSNAEIAKLLLRIAGLFAATVLTFVGVEFIDKIMNFLF